MIGKYYPIEVIICMQNIGNNYIAQVLYRTTFIESWGSGVRRMTEVCVANGVKAPVFSIQDNNFCITFHKGSDRIGNSTEKTTEKILRLLLENPNLTNQELAEKCGLTEDGVYYNIKILRQKGLIARVGSDRQGYWQVIDSLAENTTEKTTEKILRLLSENPNLTNQELAEKCGLTEDGVYYNIKILRRKGLIVRIGPDKGGYWQVVENKID